MKAAVCAVALLCVVAAFASPIKFGSTVRLDLPVLSDEIIDSVNSARAAWVAGHNDYFEGKDVKFVKSLLGARKGYKLPEKDIEIADAIPTMFDARTNWKNCTSIAEVRDQSACGSCWAFGAVEAMSDRICIASYGAKQTRVSATDLVACCDSCGDGCEGGFPGAAWDFWVHTGLVTGDLYNESVSDNGGCQPYPFAPCSHHEAGPYPACPGQLYPTPQCTKQCQSGYPVAYKSDKTFGRNSYSVSSNVAKIQTEIMTNGPVEGAFTVYADFPTYKSGVYHHVSGSELGGHAIKVLGWGVQNNEPYWLVANSWNDSWGMNGYFLIKRGSDECGIESGIVAGMPKL